MSKTVVVALGGNALIKPGEEGSVAQMRKNIREALSNVLDYISPDDKLVLTHGNGPQVGTLLLKDDAGGSHYNTPSYPLDVLVAETQGELGYLMESELRNLLAGRNLPREAATLVTMMEVNAGDPGFARPQKRVGKMYAEEEARHLEKTKQWQFAGEIKNGRKAFRRVVPSPAPVDIVNKKALQTLVERNFIVITAGGGGIPVVRENGLLRPVEAVIDKDLATALVASAVGADKFIILTDVPYVYKDYGTPKQRPLESLPLNEIPAMIEEGIFGTGNMLPKIKAAMDFVARTGKEALITAFEGLKNNTGTRIVP